jgi:hypothetical protein
MSEAIKTQRAVASWKDTRGMEWESFYGLDIGRAKLLQRNASGDPMVMMVWLPPGDLGIELPHRHYHVTVYEHAYHLTGDLPHAEWADKDADHDLVVFREGFFLDRHPGSIHGNDAVFSDTGCVILCWRNKLGNWLDEPGAELETLTVPFERPFKGQTYETRVRADRDGVVISRPDVRILDTREMPWEPLGSRGAAKVRILARDSAGAVTVRMVFVPPGGAAVEPLPSRPGDRECAMVLEGELTVAGDDGPQVVRVGYFMDRAPGAPDGLEPSGPSETGAVVLHWRMGPDTYDVTGDA